MKGILLLIHPSTGVLSAVSALWVFIETLNVTAANMVRIRIAAVLSALLMIATWITGGYWYVHYYAADKALILQGPWPFAHSLVMEAKEHIFFIALILAVLLPIVAWGNNLVASRSARLVILTVAALVFLSSLALEGMGAVISLGVKAALMAGAGR